MFGILGKAGNMLPQETLYWCFISVICKLRKCFEIASEAVLKPYSHPLCPWCLTYSLSSICGTYSFRGLPQKLSIHARPDGLITLHCFVNPSNSLSMSPEQSRLYQLMIVNMSVGQFAHTETSSLATTMWQEQNCWQATLPKQICELHITVVTTSWQSCQLHVTVERL